MSKRGIVALITVVILVIAGGAYWYLELLPSASFVQKPEETAVVATAPVAQPPTASRDEGPPPAAFKAVAEPEQELPLAVPTEESAEEEPAVVVAERIEAPTLPARESEVTIIEFDALMEYLQTHAPASALQPVALPIFGPPAPGSPEPSLPLPPEIAEPVIVEPTPVTEKSPGEVAAAVAPPTLPPLEIPREKTPLVVLPEVRTPTVGLAATALFPLYTIAPFVEAGYGIGGTLLIAPKKILQGTLGFGARKELNSGWLLDATVGARVAVGAKRLISAFIGIDAGLAINLGTPATYGLLSRATAGVLLNISNHFALSVGSGISATWFDFTTAKPQWHFEAARIGFLLSL